MGSTDEGAREMMKQAGAEATLLLALFQDRVATVVTAYRNKMMQPGDALTMIAAYVDEINAEIAKEPR